MTEIQKLRFDLVRLWCKIKNLEENGGGTGTGPSQYLIDVMEGSNIQIDKTNPKKPIISTNAVEPLTTEFVVSSPAGAMGNGAVFPGGLTLAQAFETLLKSTKYPEYRQPTFVLQNNAGTRELGEVITLTLTSTFNRGAIMGAYQNGIWNPNVSQNFYTGLPSKTTIDKTEYNTTQLVVSKTIPGYVVGANNSFSANVIFGPGPQPKDSEGQDTGIPHPGGTLTANTTFTASNRMYAGSVVDFPTTGTEVRSMLMGQSTLSTSNNMSFKTGDRIRFVIAIPANKNFVSAMVETNEQWTNLFELSSNITTVPDAGGTQRAYKVYMMKNDVPMPENYNVNVVLS